MTTRTGRLRTRTLIAAFVGAALAIALGVMAQTGTSSTRGHHHAHLSKKCKRAKRRNHRRHGFTPAPPRCPRDRTSDIVRSHRERGMIHVSDGPYDVPESGPEGGDEGSEAERKIPAGPLLREHDDPPEPAQPPIEPPDARPGANRIAPKIGNIALVRNRSLRLHGAGGLDPEDGGESSVATDGRVVIVTSNFGDAISTDGGYSFTKLDPSNLFGVTAGGFCCDQVVTYIPSVGRFVLVLQYWQGSGGTQDEGKANVVRVASATPDQVAASRGTKGWKRLDFTGADLGFDTCKTDGDKPQTFNDQLT